MKNLCLTLMALLGSIFVAQAQNAPTPNADKLPPLEWGPGLKVLIFGGGWAHDYNTWFNKADTETLHKAGLTNTHYIDDSPIATRELSNADVVVLSCNKNYAGFITPQFRNAVSNYVNSGKGLVLLHSGLWFNWAWGDSPATYDEFNQELVGGGGRSHDGEAPFQENIIKDHPVTAGLPKTFQVTDELYHTEVSPGGSPMEVLAEATRPGEKYASVWLVHYPGHDARIVCIALGHDGNSHNQPEFQKLLVNAVKWAGKQD